MTSCSEYESSDEEEPEPSPCVSDDSDVEMLSDDDAPAAAPPPKAEKRKERSGYSVDDVKRGLKILRAQYMFTHDKDKCDTLHAVARATRSGAEPPDALIKTVCAAFLRSAPRSLWLRPARPLAPPPASLGTRQSIEPTGRGVSAFVCGPSQIGRRWKEMLALESTAEQPDVDAAMDAYIEDASRVAPSKGGTRAGSTETSLSTTQELLLKFGCDIAADGGFGINKFQVHAWAIGIMRLEDPEATLSEGWAKRWMRRRHIRKEKASGICKTRAEKATASLRDEWFSIISEFVSKLHIEGVVRTRPRTSGRCTPRARLPLIAHACICLPLIASDRLCLPLLASEPLIAFASL